jgi:hypothetical protein
VPLVLIGVSVTLEVGKAQPRAIRGPPHLLGFVVFPAQQAIDRARALDRLDQLRARPPQHEPDRILAVAVGVVRPFAEHPIGFTAPARATEEHFKDGALQERHLRRVAAR